jgi:parvulin-like peptidyl-prolyl isomerase
MRIGFMLTTIWKKSFLIAIFMLFATSAQAQLLGGANLAVARVGSTDISQGKADSLIQMLVTTQFRGQQVSPEMMQQLRITVMDNLIGQELLKLETQKLNITVSAKEVDSLMTMFKSQFPDEATFRKELSKSGSTEADFRNKVQRQLQADAILEKKVPFPKDPTDAEIKKYFDEQKAKGTIPVNDTVAGAQIFMTIQPGESAASIADKKQILQGLAAQVRSKKASFAMLAAQYSDDKQAQQTGGVMGRFLAKDYDPAFAGVIKNLKVGDVSDVFQTKNGLHIFLLMEKNDGQLSSYKHRIGTGLQMEKEQGRQLQIKEYLDSLATVYGVKVLNQQYQTSIGNPNFGAAGYGPTIGGQ